MNGKFTHSLSHCMPTNVLPSLGRDDNRFLEVYPDADRNITHLIKAIRRKTRKARASKNGSPEARTSSSVSRSGSESVVMSV